MDKRIDLAIAALIVAFGCFVVVEAFGIRPTGPVVDTIGPRGFPIVIGMVFMVVGSIVALDRLRRWNDEPGVMVETDGEPDEPNVPAKGYQAWTLMALLFGYALTLVPLGYLISTPLLVALALATMRMRSLTTIVITSLLYTIITFTIFDTLMGLSLPLGPVDTILREFGVVR